MPAGNITPNYARQEIPRSSLPIRSAGVIFEVLGRFVQGNTHVKYICARKANNYRAA
jgi:hypothetical protein